MNEGGECERTAGEEERRATRIDRRGKSCTVQYRGAGAGVEWKRRKTNGREMEGNGEEGR